MHNTPATIESKSIDNGLNRHTLEAFIAKLDGNDLDNIHRINAVNERCIAEAMRNVGIVRATVDFSGGGDSGEFDEPQFWDAQGSEVTFDMPRTFLVGFNRDFCFETRTWVGSFHLSELPLDGAISGHVESVVMQTGTDWYNNDGGFGGWSMDLASGEVGLTIDINIVEAHNEHFEARAIGQLDDDGDAHPDALLDNEGLSLPAH